MFWLTCSWAATIQICCLEGHLVGVSVSLICNMYSCHSCLARSFIGLLIETSNGCNREVQPPGITAGHTLIFFIAAFTSLVRCPLKESSTKIAGLRSVNGRTHSSIYLIIKRSSIHAFSCTCSVPPTIISNYNYICNLLLFHRFANKSSVYTQLSSCQLTARHIGDPELRKQVFFCSTDVNLAKLELPTFSSKHTSIWFRRADAAFKNANIASEETRANCVLEIISETVLETIAPWLDM